MSYRKGVLKISFGRTAVFLLLLVFALLMVYPVIYIILGSFKENRELLMGGMNIFPKKFIFSNYVDAWKQANFAIYTMNSVYLSFGVMILTLLVTTMAGYVFARRHFRFKELLYGTYIAFMFVNVGIVTLRPLFELAVKVNMNTSLVSVILISAGSIQATYVFLSRGFVNSLPKEMDEAAKIDGCSFFQIYYRIILPLLKPLMATVGLLSFRAGWNEYILPLVFTMSNDSMRPLTVGVVMLKNSGDGTAAWNIMFAGATISIIPIIIIYLFSSKYFIDGIVAGAVKG